MKSFHMPTRMWCSNQEGSKYFMWLISRLCDCNDWGCDVLFVYFAAETIRNGEADAGKTQEQLLFSLPIPKVIYGPNQHEADTASQTR